MTDWNPDELTRRFLHEAQDAERYLNEIRGKVKGRPAYEHVYDEHMARFYVFNYLHGRTFLETRESLLRELKSLGSLFSISRTALRGAAGGGCR